MPSFRGESAGLESPGRPDVVSRLESGGSSPGTERQCGNTDGGTQTNPLTLDVAEGELGLLSEFGWGSRGSRIVDCR